VTGKCAGTAPWSWVKIAFASFVVLCIALTILYFFGQ
jgi:hypothetical protein